MVTPLAPPHDPPTPPPPPPKEAFPKRSNKFLLPIFLAANLSLGAYLYMRTKKKEGGKEEEAAPNFSPAPSVVTAIERPPPSTPVEVQKREPIPEDKQRELFKWILEEKRRVKPEDREEKKRIDEEKAILKQFIKAKTIPSI